jgi:hypothetical protein
MWVYQRVTCPSPSSPSRLTSGTAGAEHDELTDCQDLSTYWCQIKWQKICQIECKNARVSTRSRYICQICQSIRKNQNIFPNISWQNGRCRMSQGGSLICRRRFQISGEHLCEKTYGLEMVRVRDSQSISVVWQYLRSYSGRVFPLGQVWGKTIVIFSDRQISRDFPCRSGAILGAVPVY